MIVLDANILIRGVLGRRVIPLLFRYGSEIQFFAPDAAFAEAEEHLPTILLRRGFSISEAYDTFAIMGRIVEKVDKEAYTPFESAAKRRLIGRDLEDWPILATVLLLGSPLWTEDTDFFGVGIATWTTDRVEIFLHDSTNR
jgi:predicted nucleic acid-binding protein